MGVVITKAAEGLKVDKGDGNPQYLSQPTITPKDGTIPTIILTSSSGTVIVTIPINTLDTIGGNPPAGNPAGSDISGIVDQLTALLNNPISATTAATAARQDTGNTSLAAINTAIGAKGDAAASSDTGSFSIIAFIKRMLGNWTTLLGTKLPDAIGGRVPVEIAPSQSSVTHTAGTITTGGTAQTALAAQAGRKYLLIQNISDTVMYIQLDGGTPTATTSMMLAANGGSWESPPHFCPVVAIKILCATTGKAFITVTN
ncbi:hypothetical protein [Spirosoma aerolatum]|uniref:hypothetical protein n=1 Tax=Spirosoma aerolatum TaxID=1211326 RepID=UPI0009AEE8A7|nr:hypothetical protein [Spirosoma aerolatum]